MSEVFEELQSVYHNMLSSRVSGRPPEQLRIAEDLWDTLRKEMKEMVMYEIKDSENDRLTFLGMNVTIIPSTIDNQGLFRYSII